MFEDVIDMRDFYRTSLGQATSRTLRRQIRALWPDVSGLAVMGFGFATPYLRQFRSEAARIIACMPAAQGVLRWPPEEANQVLLADEAELPLPDMSCDRILLVHALERSEQVRPLLRELWRVLAGSGRLLVIVPNRRGIWARLDRTPFGIGSPYTPSQLSHLMRESLFTPVQARMALFVPPSNSRMLLGSAPAWEEIGRRWFPTFGGVVMLEAAKEVYAVTPLRVPKRRSRLVPAISPPTPHMDSPRRTAELLHGGNELGEPEGLAQALDPHRLGLLR
jgi:SAM-dependent methyltransferase